MQKIIGMLVISISLLSCNNYYKAITITKPGAGRIAENLNDSNRYSILRNGSQAYAMENISFTADSQYIQCNLANLPIEHKLHLTKGRKGKMIYRKRGDDAVENNVLKEVHYYMAPDAAAVPGTYNIALSKVQKIEVLEKDQKRTTKNHIITAVVITGVVVAATAGLAAIAVASMTFF